MKRIQIVTVLLAFMISCFAPVAYANQIAENPAYIISGSSQGNTYTLEIKASDIMAYSGRIGIQFDTDKLTLQGSDSLAAFKLGTSIYPVPELQPESQMVSASSGFACLAWYSSGLDAFSGEKTVATLSFRLKDGVTAEDIDSSTFRLHCIDEGDFGPWESAASMQGWGVDLPTSYEYLSDSRTINIDFTYEGSDRMPSNGKTVRFLCQDLMGEPLAASITLNSKQYTASSDGVMELILAPGDYMYRAVAQGYGDLKDKLAVSEDAQVPLVFTNDADLVKKATEELEISYQTGDNAYRVTSTLILPRETEDGVQISWQSSNPAVITREGLVYLPETVGTNVTLTATLSRGNATDTKSFVVRVMSKMELLPSYDNPYEDDLDKPNDDENNGEDTPKPAVPAFGDLAGFEWAKDSIEKMAAAGIIKGTSDTTFEPGANIKRGDFVLLLMRMFNPNASTAQGFDDVPKDSYYHDAIAMARALGIAQGTGDNRFNPEDPITRQEMITFVMRALNVTQYIPVTDERDDLSAFTDKNLVADYAYDSMSAAVAQQLIIGSGGTLNPLGNTTRAEAAVFIARIYALRNA